MKTRNILDEYRDHKLVTTFLSLSMCEAMLSTIDTTQRHVVDSVGDTKNHVGDIGVMLAIFLVLFASPLTSFLCQI